MTTKTTVTEALAEKKTIIKRLEKKEAFIQKNLTRNEALKDPLEKDGGSFAIVGAEVQSYQDLTERLVKLQAAIRKSNETTLITVGEDTRSVADWLEWRRTAAPLIEELLKDMSNIISAARDRAVRMQDPLQRAQRAQLLRESTDDPAPTNIIVNVNEKALSEQIEALQNILGTLDGQLSLKNATVVIEVED